MNGLVQLATKTRRLTPALDTARKFGSSHAAEQFLIAAKRATFEAAPRLWLNTGSGAAIGVRMTKLSDSQYLVSAFGPYQLIERPTSAHIQPRNRRRGGKRVVMALPSIGVRSVVHHPGTRGKHPFARAVARHRHEAVRTVQAQVRTAISQAMR